MSKSLKRFYLILEPHHIGEVMRGERTQLPIARHAPKGTIVGLRTDPDKPATCLMEVTACQPDPGGWTITIKPYVHWEAPRLLRAGSPLTGGKARLVSNRKRDFEDVRAKAPNDRSWDEATERGYTTNPQLALPHEPEAVDLGLLNAEWRLVSQCRHDKAMREMWERARGARAQLTVEERMAEAKRVARLNNVDVSSELFLVRRALAKRKRSETLERALQAAEARANREP